MSAAEAAAVAEALHAAILLRLPAEGDKARRTAAGVALAGAGLPRPLRLDLAWRIGSRLRLKVVGEPAAWRACERALRQA